jgi:hypothetical protein
MECLTHFICRSRERTNKYTIYQTLNTTLFNYNWLEHITMPQLITEDKIQNFLLRKTKPIPLSFLPPDRQTCPICDGPYCQQNPNNLHPSLGPDSPEYSVRIKDCGNCRHVFGRRCLERSIRANQPWSHVCPICREEWFVPPHPTRTEILGALRRSMNILAKVEGDETGVRYALEQVEHLLEGIEEVLMERRWI